MPTRMRFGGVVQIQRPVRIRSRCGSTHSQARQRVESVERCVYSARLGLEPLVHKGFDKVHRTADHHHALTTQRTNSVAVRTI